MAHGKHEVAHLDASGRPWGSWEPCKVLKRRPLRNMVDITTEGNWNPQTVDALWVRPRVRVLGRGCLCETK